MRPPRKLCPGVSTTYHTFSRTVNGAFLFKAREREQFCRHLRRLARFLQIQIFDHTVLSNHFHLVLRVPAKVCLSDRQLLKALRRFYGPKHPNTLEFARALETNSPLLPILRDSYHKRMGNLPGFMKELKEGFAKWFNALYERFGPLWSERYGSVLTGEEPWRILFFCAYVDLNSLRAGLRPDPKEYRWCGYAEALARAGPARAGLAQLLPGRSWEEKLAHYRVLLFGQGSWAKNAQVPRIEAQEALREYERRGHLPVEVLLRLKVRWFTQSAVLGAEQFVREMFERFEKPRYRRRRRAFWPVPGPMWKGTVSLRHVKDPVGLPTALPPD
jgi:REP element-mobilizing transposase RayT